MIMIGITHYMRHTGISALSLYTWSDTLIQADRVFEVMCLYYCAYEGWIGKAVEKHLDTEMGEVFNEWVHPLRAWKMCAYTPLWFFLPLISYRLVCSERRDEWFRCRCRFSASKSLVQEFEAWQKANHHILPCESFGVTSRCNRNLS